MYDFLAYGDFPDGERAPYRLIRWWLLDCCYSYCVSHLREREQKSNDIEWSEGESEIGYAYEQYENAFLYPIENLMLEVIVLVIRAGRGPEKVHAHHRAKISAILAKEDLRSMTSTLEGEELKELERDLSLLGLI